jgi:hypothetical protein
MSARPKPSGNQECNFHSCAAQTLFQSPPSSLNIEARSADQFIADTIVLDYGRAVAAIKKMRLRFKKSGKNTRAVIARYGSTGSFKKRPVFCGRLSILSECEPLQVAVGYRANTHNRASVSATALPCFPSRH